MTAPNLADILTSDPIRDGRHWVFADGTRLPIVAGGSDEPDGEDGDGNGDGGGETKTFTQAEVDRIAARARSEARKAAEREVRDYLDAQKTAADRSQLDEAARAKAEADEAKAQAEADRQAAKAERLAARIERRLVGAGVDDKALARAARLIDLDPADDPDDDTIAAEIDQLKTDVPGLFAANSGTTTATPPPGGTAGRPPKTETGTGKTLADLGRETAARFGLPTSPANTRTA